MKIFAYSNSFHNDAVTQRLKACCDDWHSIAGISDEIVSEKIREDGIDILIDLSGHTMYNRLPLFAWKPAPVQVTWLGYFATTGVTAIDYLLADPWTLPESEESKFHRKDYTLAGNEALLYAPGRASSQSASLPALSNGHITFGCFNTLTKMNDEVVELWSQVLHAVPNSKLFLMANQLREPSVQQETTKRFLDHGIDEERLILKGGVPRGDYLATYHQVDIALDPFPYCGGTTSVEALWMGVPVLTLGRRAFSLQTRRWSADECRAVRMGSNRSPGLCAQGGGTCRRPSNTGFTTRANAKSGAGIANFRRAAFCQSLRGRAALHVARLVQAANCDDTELSDATVRRSKFSRCVTAAFSLRPSGNAQEQFIERALLSR